MMRAEVWAGGHQGRITFDASHPGSPARWIRLLAERRHGRESPLRVGVAVASSLQGPALVGLQVVVVMAQEGQVARKSLIRPHRPTPSEWGRRTTCLLY